MPGFLDGFLKKLKNASTARKNCGYIIHNFTHQLWYKRETKVICGQNIIPKNISCFVRHHVVLSIATHHEGKNKTDELDSHSPGKTNQPERRFDFLRFPKSFSMMSVTSGGELSSSC